MDYPFGVIAKVRRWQALGAEGFYDVRGRRVSGDLHANSLACRAALLNPATDPHSFLRSVAQRWYGPAAAPLVMSAWQALERGQAIRSNGYNFPSSSALSEYVPWHIAYSKLRLPLPTNPNFTAKLDTQSAPGGGEYAPAPANGWIYHEGDYPQLLATTGQSLVDAAECFRDAGQRLGESLGQSLPDSIPDAALWLGEGFSATPSEYLRQLRAYVETLQNFDALMGCHFLLKSLYMRVDGNPDAYRKQGGPRLAAYAKAARSLADYIDQLNREKMLTGPIPKDWSSDVLRGLAKEVEAWLS